MKLAADTHDREGPHLEVEIGSVIATGDSQ
jgi:hypothetical protein